MAESFAGRLSQLKFGYDNSLLEHYVHVAFDNLGVIEDFEATFTRKSAPDGICLDEAGNIWVANPLEAKVRCISPTGKQVDEVVISQVELHVCSVAKMAQPSLFAPVIHLRWRNKTAE